ncbi:hypothetical protein [Spiroplasma turonicum]|uniref:PTS system, mannitol-specific IIBC component n=2 Tax=Spiroplasma turonicum TaxID=216946 RepID=A0A0K1P642_9MOLU|nr:hypothetical protein [Spiroplasma turonicum]AKU79783.1 PTS system, mannitol-specific IIBC component [Spiroplasma turonicum]
MDACDVGVCLIVMAYRILKRWVKNNNIDIIVDICDVNDFTNCMMQPFAVGYQNMQNSDFDLS